MNNFFLIVGGRKFLAYIVGIIVSVYMFERGLSVFKKVSAEMIISLIKENHTQILLLTGIYLGINVFQKIKENTNQIKDEE